MGLKRKAQDSQAAPRTVQMTISDDIGAFATYFPSGFRPDKAAEECSWQAFQHTERKEDCALLVKTVRFSFACRSAKIEIVACRSHTRWGKERGPLHPDILKGCFMIESHSFVPSIVNP